MECPHCKNTIEFVPLVKDDIIKEGDFFVTENGLVIATKCIGMRWKETVFHPMFRYIDKKPVAPQQ